MKLQKVIGFIIVAIIIACMIPTTVTASTGFELGEFNIISENNQQNGWCTNGVDGIETKLYIRALQRVTNLFFELDSEAGNITLVCFGDGNGWTWTETPVEVNGNWFSIDVENINGWAEAISGNDAKILLCNYNPSWEGIKVKGFTSMPGGPFENEAAWTPKNFKIGAANTIITAVDFDPDNFEEHGAEYARYTVRPEMEAIGGPQTEVGHSGFGDNICCIDAGEWVQYTVEVTAAGTYGFSAWLASDYLGNSGNIEVYVDDVFVGASADSASGYYELYPVSGNIDLPIGTHIIKTVFPKSGVTFSALEVISLKANETPNFISSAPDTGDDAIYVLSYLIIFIVLSLVFSLKKLNSLPFLTLQRT